MKTKQTLVLAALAALGLAGSGCAAATDLADALGISVEIQGSTDIVCEGFEGDCAPDITYELFGLADNETAFDNAVCEARFSASGSASAGGDDAPAEKVAAAQDEAAADDDAAAAEGEGEAEGEATCFGEIIADNLTVPYTLAADPEAPADGEYVFTDNGDGTWSMTEVPPDLFVIFASATVADGNCSGDVIGYDDETRVVTSESAISPKDIGELLEGVFSLPRPVQIYCQAAPPAPTPPADPQAPVPGEVPAPVVDPAPAGDEALPVPDPAAWTTFTFAGDKSGDASAAAFLDDVVCDDGVNIMIDAVAAAAFAGSPVAYVQEGRGENAVIRTQYLKPYDTTTISGEYISLSGGYAAIQLDTDDDPTNGGLSNIAEFCAGVPAAGEPPIPQQLLVVVTWDVDDTDIDTHVYANGEETWYADKNNDWGNLDVDDVNGFGPETFSSTPGVFDETAYEVAIHYYSDHGNGATTVQVRILYVCSDLTTVYDLLLVSEAPLATREWAPVGTFGPELCTPAAP